MQDLFFVRKFSAVQYVSPESDNLVHIHIALSAASCLPDNEREIIIQLSFEYFIANFSDQVTFFFR